MILGFKKHLPDGTPTNFIDKIIAGVADLGFIEEPIKLHTIRPGSRWRAGMSIQMVVNRRTKDQQQFNKGMKLLDTCISTQTISMTYDLLDGSISAIIDGKKVKSSILKRLIQNDGLTTEQFIEWFFSESTEFTGQIIHWTDLKYTPTNSRQEQHKQLHESFKNNR